jgi:cell division protein FtsZ
VDAAMKNRLCVTVIAAKQNPVAPAELPAGAASGDSPEQMISRGAARPASRCTPQTPSYNLQQRGQLPVKNAGGRARRGDSKMRQTQLPLAIISKGRFDKSEPTIHQGEDLDIPTYIRRGVALN